MRPRLRRTSTRRPPAGVQPRAPRSTAAPRSGILPPPPVGEQEVTQPANVDHNPRHRAPRLIGIRQHQPHRQPQRDRRAPALRHGHQPAPVSEFEQGRPWAVRHVRKEGQRLLGLVGRDQSTEPQAVGFVRRHVHPWGWQNRIRTGRGRHGPEGENRIRQAMLAHHVAHHPPDLQEVGPQVAPFQRSVRASHVRISVDRTARAPGKLEKLAFEHPARVRQLFRT